MAQMVAERETVRATIIKSMQLPVNQYSIYAAMDDLRRFIWAGTIPGSIQSIAKDAGEKATKADKDIQEIITAKYVKDDAGDLLRAYWKPDTKNINKPNEEKLKEWMKSHGLSVEPGAITSFIRDDDKADLRVRAVHDLLQK